MTAGTSAFAGGLSGRGPAADAETQARERQAVRGAPVEDVRAETEELRAVREFEEGHLRATPLPPGAAPADLREPGAAARAPGTLPGSWAGTGDVPEILRTPAAARGTRPIAPPAAAPDSAFLAGLARPQLPLRWDPRVLKYLDYFRTDPRGRAIMGAWLRRLGRYQAMFEGIFDREGVPRDLMFLAMVESGLQPVATSRVGAGGIWQFMPASGRAYGLEVSHWRDERQDPERSTEAAARYLKDLHVRFGTWELAFAAYNAGYGAVLRSIRAYNTNDYWELVSHESGLPWESSVYVPKILAVAIIGHNREAFGFTDVGSDPPFEYDRVEAAQGTSLKAIAKAAGVEAEVVEALNPELIRQRLPPDRAASLVRIPRGTAAAYAAATRHKDEVLETVVLRFGETLGDVARAREVSLRELKKLNGVEDSADVTPGTAIVVPREHGDPSDDPRDRDDEADDQILVAVPDKTFNLAGRERVFYKTRTGDRLDEIAEVFRVRVADLVEWNNTDPAAKLQSGMVLQVFVPKTFDPAGVLLLDPARVRVVVLGSEDFLELLTARRGKERLYYTVRSGDTLQKVGRRYGLSTGDLARINQFSYLTRIEAGQKIVVYSPKGEPARQLTHARKVATKRPSRSNAPKSSRSTKASKSTKSAKASKTTKSSKTSKTSKTAKSTAKRR